MTDTRRHDLSRARCANRRLYIAGKLGVPWSLAGQGEQAEDAAKIRTGSAEATGGGAGQGNGTLRDAGGRVAAFNPTTAGGGEHMDWSKLQAALIRAFWTVVFPLIGSLVNWLATGDNLKEIGVTNSAIILGVSALCYGLKKYKWPDTTF